jgi:hypothetical protein
MTRPLPQALAALLLYAALAALLIWHGASLTGQYSGFGADPYDGSWFLAWWPYAISHHLDPFFTRLIWYPYGVSTLWITSVPLLAVLAWPVTALAGPVLSYNLLMLTAPPLAAWTAYFLCRHVTRDFWASLIGGFLFGYSSYEMAQDLSPLNLAVIFCVPALLLVALKRLDDELSRPAAVAWAALLLLAQFLICIEIFAMIFLFGGIVWLLAYAYLPPRRLVLRRLVVDGLCAAPFVVLPLVPLLCSMVRHYGLIHHPDLWPYFFTGNLLNVFIPSTVNLFGGAFGALNAQFGGGPAELDAYLGLPLILLVVLFARQQGGTGHGRVLLLSFLILLVCSLGPRLWVGSYFTSIVLPWALFMHLPLLGQALTSRFAMFTSLACSLIAACWLVAPGGRKWRYALAVLACVTLLPQPHPWRPLPTAAFFAPGRVQAVLGENPRLLILPFAINGPSSYWQVENQFGFTEVGGYLGFPPRPAQNFKAVGEMFANNVEPDFLPEFTRYAMQNGAQYVVAGPGANPAMIAAIASLGWPRRNVDDVVIFTVPKGAP